MIHHYYLITAADWQINLPFLKTINIKHDHFSKSYLLLHVKNLSRCEHKTKYNLATVTEYHETGIKLLFIFGIVDYKTRRENLKERVQIVSETRRRHSRSQESPVSLFLIQRNRQNTTKQKPNTTKTRHPQKQHLPHVIIPRNKQMTSTRIQTAHQAGHFYNLTIWLLYTDM